MPRTTGEAATAATALRCCVCRYARHRMRVLVCSLVYHLAWRLSMQNYIGIAEPGGEGWGGVGEAGWWHESQGRGPEEREEGRGTLGGGRSYSLHGRNIAVRSLAHPLSFPPAPTLAALSRTWSLDGFSWLLLTPIFFQLPFSVLAATLPALTAAHLSLMPTVCAALHPENPLHACVVWGVAKVAALVALLPLPAAYLVELKARRVFLASPAAATALTAAAAAAAAGGGPAAAPRGTLTLGVPEIRAHTNPGE